LEQQPLRKLRRLEADITTNLRGKECKGEWQKKGSSTSQAVTDSN